MALRPWGKTILTIVASFLIVSLAGVAYTNVVQQQAKEDFRTSIRESEQKWCSVLGIFESTYKVNPPTTPQGRDVAAKMHNLYADFGCSSG